MYRANVTFRLDEQSTFDVLAMCRQDPVETELRGLSLAEAKRYTDFEATPLHKVAVEKSVPSEMLLKYVTDSELARQLEVHISERGTTVECRTILHVQDSHRNGLSMVAVFKKHFEIPFSNLDASHHVLSASIEYAVRIVYDA